MRTQAIVLAAALAMAPLGARAADLVVWWEQGFYPQEDEAVAEIVAAFEQETGKQVELVQHPHGEHPEQVRSGARCRATARLPVWHRGSTARLEQWAYEDRLVDLTGRPWLRCGPVRRRRARVRRRLLNGKHGPSAAFMRCRWGADPTTSMSGRAFSSGPASPSPTFRASGSRSGPSGVTGCSRRCARPWAGTTSGPSALPMSIAATDTRIVFIQFQLAYRRTG